MIHIYVLGKKKRYVQNLSEFNLTESMYGQTCYKKVYHSNFSCINKVTYKN
jgi:hypothetical protein